MIVYLLSYEAQTVAVCASVGTAKDVYTEFAAQNNWPDLQWVLQGDFCGEDWTGHQAGRFAPVARIEPWTIKGNV